MKINFKIVLFGSGPFFRNKVDEAFQTPYLYFEYCIFFYFLINILDIQNTVYRVITVEHVTSSLTTFHIYLEILFIQFISVSWIVSSDTFESDRPSTIYCTTIGKYHCKYNAHVKCVFIYTYATFEFRKIDKIMAQLLA